MGKKKTERAIAKEENAVQKSAQLHAQTRATTGPAAVLQEMLIPSVQSKKNSKKAL